MAIRSIFITGASGMVGRELASLAAGTMRVTAKSRAELDVSDRAAVTAALAADLPDAVLHAGAFTNVDGCETDPDVAYRVNALGTRNVAETAFRLGVPVLYISTDYVFDGTAAKPYVEFDAVGPRSVYGRSKLAGEEFVRSLAGGRYWIVRSQWIFGFHGKNFVDTIANAAAAAKPLRIVDDQTGCPTFARDLARGILAILTRDPGFGTYHCSAGGSCTWFDFAREIVRLTGAVPASLDPMKSADLDRPAPRPAYSVLRNYALEQTIGDPMRPWQEGLREYLVESRPAGSAAKGPPPP